MRSPLNNPTERIGRLIEEFDEGLYLIAQLYAYIQDAGQTMDLPAMPRFPNLEAERVRRSLTYTRSIHKDRRRKSLDKVRGGDGPGTVRSLSNVEPLSTADIMEALEKDRANERAKVIGDSFKKPDKLDL